MTPNGLQLGEVGEIEAQMFSFVQKFNRRTVVQFSTEPAILPNRLLNKAYGSFGSISLIAFIGVNFEKSFNRTKKIS
jgi:hypothetical protein